MAVGGVNWPERFENCLKRVRLIDATEGEYVGDPEVFAYASRLAMGLTILRAQQLSSEPIQLAVWDGQETAEKAGSFADIQVWQRQGLKTVTIGSDGNLGANGVKPPSRKAAPIRYRAAKCAPSCSATFTASADFRTGNC